MIGLLIRHGNAEPAQPLDSSAPDTTAQLVRDLRWAPLAAVYASPAGRAIETAHPLAADHGLDLRVRPALTGTGGDRREDIERRLVDELMALSRSHPGETVAIVTTAETIRCALSALGGATLTSDGGEIAIDPMMVSAIGITQDVRRVLGINIPAYELAV